MGSSTEKAKLRRKEGDRSGVLLTDTQNKLLTPRKREGERRNYLH
jgi:hypothetical protein